ncbi:hypothetical protein RHGRI_008808 [Rhododendron griersonianum]|uniref:Uncharacterized protein n=2 Tax=Rhododendron griersonianum TaxID=479676 RepID=A0AAV6L1K6_9ERIC|nr:hypothetical protein RHGRI_008808 [Rhododendron griersonianum]
MEKKAKVICSVVGFLGLLSAVLGFAAEAKRTKASQVQVFTAASACIYPSSPASGLGLAAALTLMVAQIIISITTGCFCCRRHSYLSNSNRRLAIICFVISWITFVHAFLMLLAGAAINYYHGYYSYPGNSCPSVKPGFFAGAAVLSLATVVLGIVYYLALDSAKTSNDSWNGTAAAPNQGGISMGHPRFPPPQYPPGAPPQYPPGAPPQYPPGAPPLYPPPQFPPPNTKAPIFVHEDTYMRRQFT